MAKLCAKRAIQESKMKECRKCNPLWPYQLPLLIILCSLFHGHARTSDSSILLTSIRSEPLDQNQVQLRAHGTLMVGSKQGNINNRGLHEKEKRKHGDDDRVQSEERISSNMKIIHVDQKLISSKLQPRLHEGDDNTYQSIVSPYEIGSLGHGYILQGHTEGARNREPETVLETDENEDDGPSTRQGSERSTLEPLIHPILISKDRDEGTTAPSIGDDATIDVGGLYISGNRSAYAYNEIVNGSQLKGAKTTKGKKPDPRNAVKETKDLKAGKGKGPQGGTQKGLKASKQSFVHNTKEVRKGGGIKGGKKGAGGDAKGREGEPVDKGVKGSKAGVKGQTYAGNITSENLKHANESSAEVPSWEESKGRVKAKQKQGPRSYVYPPKKTEDLNHDGIRITHKLRKASSMGKKGRRRLRKN